MSAVLVLQTARRRDVADDAALGAVARALFPANVVAATADPERTSRAVDLPVVPATSASLLRLMTTVDTLVVLGGRPLQADAGTETLGLSAVYSVATAYRLAGKRVALVGVGAGETTGRGGRLVRQTVLGSALTVLDSDASAAHVASVGVPPPFRVGPDLAWLDLQAPPPPPAPHGPVRLPVGSDELSAAGGATALAALLRPVLDAVRAQRPAAGDVVVQARRRGESAGDDLDAADALAAALAAAGAPASVEPAAVTLSARRDELGRSGFALCGEPRTMMAAAAAAVPVLGWAADARGRAAARELEIPLVGGADELPGGVDLAVETAAGRAGSVHSAARRHVAAAGDVLDLLTLLVSEGDAAAHPAAQGAATTTTSATGAEDRPAPSGLRPPGVTR